MSSQFTEVRPSPDLNIHDIADYRASITDNFQYKVIRRNGDISDFDPSKIYIAISKAFLAVEGSQSNQSNRIHDVAQHLATQVVTSLTRNSTQQSAFHIEDIQDQVELALMREGHYKIAKAYVLYRDEQKKIRSQNESSELLEKVPSTMHYKNKEQELIAIDFDLLANTIDESCQDLNDVDAAQLFEATKHNLYDGISQSELAQAPILACRTYIEKEPNYNYVCARLLLNNLRHDTLSYVYGKDIVISQQQMQHTYAEYFTKFIKLGVEAELLNNDLLNFDLEKMGSALNAQKDFNFQYLGLQTLYDRYFLHIDDNRIELPQAFFMRVAMGLALNEINREDKAIEFYNLISSFDFMCSTPTLFNSGTLRSQLSSCYLTTVPDDLKGIYKSLQDNALLAKYSGGLGNDWTRVRGLGAKIKGTNGKSQGVIPFLKVANDTAVAVNQGGKRKGAVCAYLETWHIDIEEFLDLRKNTGDDRRRAHDMNTANWIPDLFMDRVINNQTWTLFSPEEVTDLHSSYGETFNEKYVHYENLAVQGSIKNFKTVKALDLWRKMLTMLFETGHPWITFKDPCNIRSPQQHDGMVNSSNLCTEITLNTSDEETAVCNLGSINLAQHINEHGLDADKLKRTINTAIRMLDNVIDINFYNTKESRQSNLKHRPIGIGIMGFQDALFKLKIDYASDEAVTFADQSMELVSYFAIDSSADLASERGAYSSFQGSLWSQGILPIDSMNLLIKHRQSLTSFDEQAQQKLNEISSIQHIDWSSLREKAKNGMRNSNTMAIAPTATISNICGVSQSIEPIYQNLFVKSNLSGEFTIINQLLVNDLKALGLWDEVMVTDIKYYDGSIQLIDRIPDDIKSRYQTAFEVGSHWIIEAAARRQKWIDQAQSLNLYIAKPSGKALDDLYKLAWTSGLKTTYYLRGKSATHVEKSTLKNNDGRLNAVKASISDVSSDIVASNICSIDDPDCEACQ